VPPDEAGRAPGAEDARHIARRFAGESPLSWRRFPTGIGHWVYDVETLRGRRFVVRIARAADRQDFVGAVHWSRLLRPLGVPLPQILGQGELRGLPYLVLARLPGEDLGNVYGELTSEQRRAIAAEVCRIQGVVGALPQGKGYGYVRGADGPYLDTWAAVVDASLARSRSRLGAGLHRDAIARVQRQAAAWARYFDGILPTPFLDDTTTKNVIVHEGCLTGIVDVDWVCYGDPLLTIGLTRTALLSAGLGVEYTDAWCALLDLSPEQHAAVRFYTALFCVDFLSEIGQRFNRDPASPDAGRTELLTEILAEQLADA
jgi:hypothetical protein